MSDILAKLPHRRMEAWKWTDVQRAVSGDETGLSKAVIPHFDIPEGVSLREMPGSTQSTTGEKTPMGHLAQMVGGPVWGVSVLPCETAAEPLVISNLSQGHARIHVTLGQRSGLTIIEYYDGHENGFSNLDMIIKMGAGARLNRIIIHKDPASHVRVSTCHITMDKASKLNQHCLSFGGALSRLETRISAPDKGVEAVVNGAYLLDGKRHVDMTSHMDMGGEGPVIRQAVKGVVTDKARGVFQGKFHVEQAAQHTDAEMRHDALMLSDTSEIRAKPELEIYADDVACAHGNTIGQLDESALFYMRQRGIPAAEARALLTEAFVADVFDDLDDDVLRESLLTKVREWLEAQS